MYILSNLKENVINVAAVTEIKNKIYINLYLADIKFMVFENIKYINHLLFQIL